MPLNAEAAAQLEEFLIAFVEERQWNRSASQSRAAAVSSWRADVLAKPAPVTGRALTPQELYVQLSQSVFQVRTCAISQVREECVVVGSAVAVSPTQLATNAHVTSVPGVLHVRGEDQQLEVKIVAVDPRTDRAVLQVLNVERKLVPVRGVRDFSSLRAGEPVIAIGSPQGLDDTISSGVISALRPEYQLVMGGVADCVQTTAEISGGSSGGGLFDDRGNLVGITTQQYRPDKATGLNFAISADAFFRP